MALSKPPLQQSFLTGQLISREWANWLAGLWQLVGRTGLNGTTANRPTTGLYIGMDYFDTTLGYKVTLKSANPSVWVNGAGTVV